MTGLLVYGSLMHPDEVAAHAGASRAMIPVRVRGFRRSFCQEPVWRGGSGPDRGVLTLRRSPGDWINAVLVASWDEAELAALDHRERGYTRESVAAADVEPYAVQESTDPLPSMAIYVGRPERWRPGLEPNPEYLALCLAAAKLHGDEFLADFLATTFVGGHTLGALGHGG